MFSEQIDWFTGLISYKIDAAQTLTFNRVVVRDEDPPVEMSDTNKDDGGLTGTGFGRTGNKTAQDRLMVEGGVTLNVEVSARRLHEPGPDHTPVMVLPVEPPVDRNRPRRMLVRCAASAGKR